MSLDRSLSILVEAAQQLWTVFVSINTEQGKVDREIEPYSILRREGTQILYFWDLSDRCPGMVRLSQLQSVTASSRHFELRYIVEL